MAKWILVTLALLGIDAARADEDAVALITTVSDQILTKLQTDAERIRAEPDYLLQLVDELLVPHIDQRTIARRVLGQHWQAASEILRDQFAAEFRKYTARFYARVFYEYAGEEIPVEHSSVSDSQDGRRAIVRGEITPPGGEVVDVRYKLRKAGDCWKVYDIIVDGVSLVETNLSQFDSLIRRDGLEHVIASMTERNARPLR